MNYSERQTKLGTPAFFHLHSSSLFMPSRSGKRTFLLAFGMIQMMQGGVKG